MNGTNLMLQMVAESEHRERLQKADERRMIRTVHDEREPSRTIRGRIGLVMMRAGARITPVAEMTTEQRSELAR